MRTRQYRDRVLLMVLAWALLACGSVVAETHSEDIRIDGVRVNYKVVLPDGYSPDREYPAIMVFGGGPQTMQTIDATLTRNFAAEAQRRGYIVIGPAAPRDELFFRGGERIFPRFLDEMLARYPVAGGQFHLAGPSNGGIAAMHVAVREPAYFRSVTAFPGYLWQPDNAKLDALRGICVFLYIGENDPYPWHDEMAREAEYLRAAGSFASFSIESGQAHRLESLAGNNAGRLFADFERANTGCDLP